MIRSLQRCPPKEHIEQKGQQDPIHDSLNKTYNNPSLIQTLILVNFMSNEIFYGIGEKLLQSQCRPRQRTHSLVSE